MVESGHHVPERAHILSFSPLQVSAIVHMMPFSTFLTIEFELTVTHSLWVAPFFAEETVFQSEWAMYWLMRQLPTPVAGHVASLLRRTDCASHFVTITKRPTWLFM